MSGLSNKVAVITGAAQGIGRAIAERFVNDGARKQLLASERERFLKEEWPAMVNRIEQLGLDASSLLGSIEEERD